MRFYWESLYGTHFEGLFDPAIDTISPHSRLLHSARTVAQLGVDARCLLENVEFTTTKHHASARDKLKEALADIWKDAQKLRVVIFTGEVGHLLKGVVPVPLGWVPKTFPDRTESTTEGRIVHDPNVPNLTSPKHQYFPALMPKHSEVARTLLWWHYRLPGIPLLLSKKDVAEAFLWLWLLAESAGVFACNFHKGEASLPCDLVCLWLCLNFGWRGGSRGLC